MINFYPGPSKIYPQIGAYMQDAIQEGILSMNHRSPACMRLLQETIAHCKEKLGIPADYTVFFASSATECWEIIAQSCLRRQGTVLHSYQGAFGKKWANYTQKLTEYAQKEVKVSHFSFEDYPLPDEMSSQAFDLMCFTPCETSNGTAISYQALTRLLPTHALSAFDVTSCLGGVDLPLHLGDIWFASVQKCLGLPAGLALGILSPRAVELAYQIQERSHYNSLVNILDNVKKFQTPYTPNVLGIYLLNKVLQQIPHIQAIDAQTHKRAQDWYAFFENFEDYKPLALPTQRAATVICMESTPEKITHLKQKMEEKGIILGNGYDIWKENTFRLANFPAITEEDIAVGKVAFERFR